MTSTTTNIGIGLGLLIAILFLAYKLCKPQPLPGIPYNEQSTRRILGDTVEAFTHVVKTGQLWDWVVAQNTALNSPIVQIFPVPFSEPWVIISDFREAQDILLRRTKEFDRSHIFSDVFKGLVPDHHITMMSDHPKFKAHRKLVQDLMTPAFLNDIAASRIYTVATSLCRLWDEKTRLANGRPFSAFDDFYRAALDAIWSVTFPSDPRNGIIPAQVHLLAGLKALPDSALPERNSTSTRNKEAVIFPEVSLTPEQESILTLTESLGAVIKSPLPPGVTSWLLSLLPRMRRATSHKEAMITKQLQEVQMVITELPKDEAETKCAMEFILRRELAAATREGRQPVYHSRMIYDELFGLLVAGHDTTSTTLLWGLKNLTDNQEAQVALQTSLHETFADARAGCRPPTMEEITRAHDPYLDATLEEIVRTSLTASMVTRVATKDASVLGHHIPRGTSLLFLNNGPGYLKPPVGVISESQRSEGARMAKLRTGSWDPKDIHLFRPERWLVKKADQTHFDSTAGPHLGFGLGPRGCFGKRLAYLQMKIFLVLLVWNFDLMPIPPSLSGFDAMDSLTHQPRQCYVKLEKRRVS